MAIGMSLHIGINRVDPAHYAGWSGPLVACEADAHAMQAIAQEKGFITEMALTADATRKTLEGFFDRCAAKLNAGDMMLLTYSGHGGQVPDLSGEEPDREDETWCLYDGQFIDDEIYLGLSKLRAGVRVLVLSDSCHSGTVTKFRAYATLEPFSLSALGAARPVYRAMPPEIAARTFAANRRYYEDMAVRFKDLPPKAERGDDLKATVRLLSGCQDNQLSLDGTFNGAFTSALLQVWSGGRFKGDYQDFHKAILDLMPPSQSPNHLVIGPANRSYDRQKPFTLDA